MTLDSVRAIRFDCYGTLIDWEGGMATALADVPGLDGVDTTAFLAAREEVELSLEAESFRSDDEILALSLQRTAEPFGLAVVDSEARRFAWTLPDWPPLPDAGPFLRRLQRLRRPLVALSKVTARWLRLSLHTLPAPFDRTISADEAHACKGVHQDGVQSRAWAPQHWLLAQAALGLEAGEFPHIAASLRHDVRPA